MTVKVILMKSGEDVISDAQEIIDKENKGINSLQRSQKKRKNRLLLPSKNSLCNN